MGGKRERGRKEERKRERERWKQPTHKQMSLHQRYVGSPGGINKITSNNMNTSSCFASRSKSGWESPWAGDPSLPHTRSKRFWKQYIALSFICMPGDFHSPHTLHFLRISEITGEGINTPRATGTGGKCNTCSLERSSTRHGPPTDVRECRKWVSVARLWDG